MQRFTYVGTPTLTKDVKQGGVPDGRLHTGESGVACPVDPAHVGGFWKFTSDRGFTMMCPKQDLRTN